MVDIQELERRIDQALGREPADLVVRNARVLNTATGQIDLPTDVAVTGDTIVAVRSDLEGREVIDAGEKIAAPGFIDTHLHLESSMVVPSAFERLVVPRGTTTAICDPHEIANVLGADGIRYFLDASQHLHLSLKVNLSSCVPATHLETAGARLELEDLLALADHPSVIGLAEMMNFPGVLAKDPLVLAKLAGFGERHIDGHCPLVTGADLDAYLACGIRTDHEATLREEALEKLGKGAVILMREGSVAKNVSTLAPLLTEATWPSIAFCTDDRNPAEIEAEGHIDHCVRLAIRAGVPAIAAYRSATLAAAQTFGLTDRGLIGPGRRADILLIDDLEAVRVAEVVVAGKRFDDRADQGSRSSETEAGRRSVRLSPISTERLAVEAKQGPRPVIGVRPLSLFTDRLSLALPSENGVQRADPSAGIHKLAVVERHGKGGSVGLGFVRGFGPMAGALATSVGHDCHNLTVVGAADEDMAAAINALIAMEGGLVAVQDGKVLAQLPLPIAGLISDRPASEVIHQLNGLKRAARDLGCVLEEPFMQLAFLPLPVIPHLKLTDRGLVDVDAFRIVEES